MASNKIGSTIEKTQEATKKLDDITGKINNVNRYAILVSDVLDSIKTTLNNNVDENLYDVRKELKLQAKSYAYQKVLENIPTEQELIDLIVNQSCDIQSMNIVKKVKNNFESVLNKSKNILNSSVTKLDNLKKKTDKSLETLTNISLLLVIFQSLITALEILVEAARISLLVFTGIFASGVGIVNVKKIIDDAEALIFKYTGAIKTYSNYALRVVNTIISIINFIPIVIELFKNLERQVDYILSLVLKYYEMHIRQCLGDEGFDNDGNLSVENIDRFLDFETSNLNNLNNDILGEYTRDSNERRIFRPKIN